jgi:hypothetical protein
MKKILFALCALLLSSTLLAYVIYLKDGSTYQAKAKYTVENGKAIITLLNGTVWAVDLKMIDAAKTESANKAGMDADGVLTSVGPGTVKTDTPQRQGLGSITKNPGSLTTPSNLTSGNNKSTGASPAGGGKQREADFADESVRRAFGKIFENVNLFEYKIAEGATPGTVRITMTTDNEKDIFNALTATAKVMSELNDLGKKNVSTLELYLTTTSGAAAGRFAFNVEAAKTLAEGKVPVEQFFIDKVLF